MFGTDNLFIASASVFPTSGSACPTFAIVALALRLADYLTSTTPASARVSSRASTSVSMEARGAS
ncbi:MAG TPA: GMC oxidoreductase [Patescibacteria group bacterium]|nr:GMC oxidoreductase [Patescibacteria group bacterium]